MPEMSRVPEAYRRAEAAVGGEVVKRSSSSRGGGGARVRRPAAGVTLAYLAVTLPAAINAVVVTEGGATPVAVLHVLALAGTWWSWRGRPEIREVADVRRRVALAVADWLPLLLVAFLYSELPTLMVGLGGSRATTYHDVVVRGWEEALFGGQPSRTMAGALPFGWLSELLHAGYLSYYGIIYLPPLVLYVSAWRNGRREAFERCELALMLAFTVCFLVFVVFPVQGPRYVWPAPAGVPDGPMRRSALWVLTGGSSRGAAFPSSHAAVAVAQATSLWLLGSRRWAWVISAFTGLLLVGAVYGGFHYAVDMAAGSALGVAIAFFASGRARRLA